MKTIEQMRFSQMNPSHSSTCTIGGGTSILFVEKPQKSCCEKQNLCIFRKIGRCVSSDRT